MAVVQTRNVGDGVFVPFRVPKRAGAVGDRPVGTLGVDSEAVGTATGGTVRIQLAMDLQEFGFPIIWVPTVISLSDNLASPIVVTFGISGSMPRMQANLEEAVVLVATPGLALNVGIVENVSIPMESNAPGQEVMFAVWGTNTDTKIYHLHAFGPVYDAQVMANEGEVPDLVAGLR